MNTRNNTAISTRVSAGASGQGALQRQAGLTMWGWLVVLAMVGFIAMQGFAIMPAAANYITLKSILDELSSETALQGKSKKEIIATIQKRADFNNVGGFSAKDPAQCQLTKIRNGGYKVQVVYEQQAHLFGPVGLVLTLEHGVDSVGR